MGLDKWGKWTITCAGKGQVSGEGQAPHFSFAQVCRSGGWVCTAGEYTTGFNKRLMCGSEKQGEGVTSVLLSTLERKVNGQTVELAEKRRFNDFRAVCLVNVTSMSCESVACCVIVINNAVNSES